MDSELLRNSKTDVTPNRQKLHACRVCDVPIRAQPDVHSGTHANICRNSGQQNVAATPTLRNAGHAIVLRAHPCQDWTDKPFARHVLRFVWPVRQPETRLDVAAEPGFLGSVSTQEGMEVLIGNQTS